MKSELIRTTGSELRRAGGSRGGFGPRATRAMALGVAQNPPYTICCFGPNLVNSRPSKEGGEAVALGVATDELRHWR